MPEQGLHLWLGWPPEWLSICGPFCPYSGQTRIQGPRQKKTHCQTDGVYGSAPFWIGGSSRTLFPDMPPVSVLAQAGLTDGHPCSRLPGDGVEFEKLPCAAVICADAWRRPFRYLLTNSKNRNCSAGQTILTLAVLIVNRTEEADRQLVIKFGAETAAREQEERQDRIRGENGSHGVCAAARVRRGLPALARRPCSGTHPMTPRNGSENRSGRGRHEDTQKRP